MKRILLISYNYYPEPTGIGKYNAEMINWLVRFGYECSVITAYPYYPFWKVQEPYCKGRFSFSTEQIGEPENPKLQIFRCPLYVPLRPTGLSRILLEFSFLATAFFRLLLLLPSRKFDVVIAVAPSFQVGLLGLLYKKIRRAKLLYHIQDLQIEAARDLHMIKSRSIINTLLKTEKQILHSSDMVSSISAEMVGKIKKKGANRTFLFPNWTNVEQFFPLKNRNVLKKEFGFLETDKIIMYSGAIGEKQGLLSILHSAAANRKYKNIKFIICGGGPYKERLVEMASDMGLPNVYFFSLQPLERFNQFLNMADVHLVIQKASASDLVMPSKLGAILAVGGVALITANRDTALYRLVKEHNIGMVVKAGDQHAFDEGIQSLLKEGHEELRKNARNYAVKFLSIDHVMGNFETTFKRLWKTDSSLVIDHTVERELQSHIGEENITGRN